MSRPRNNKRRSRRTRRSRRNGVAQFVRGLILEGLAVSVLIFLYFSVQATASSPIDQEAIIKSESPAVQTAAMKPSTPEWLSLRR